MHEAFGPSDRRLVRGRCDRPTRSATSCPGPALWSATRHCGNLVPYGRKSGRHSVSPSPLGSREIEAIADQRRAWPRTMRGSAAAGCLANPGPPPRRPPPADPLSKRRPRLLVIAYASRNQLQIIRANLHPPFIRAHQSRVRKHLVLPPWLFEKALCIYAVSNALPVRSQIRDEHFPRATSCDILVLDIARPALSCA